jgi:Flp pilus assembly pilin Flp
MDNIIAIGAIVAIGNALKTQFKDSPLVTGIFGIAISVVLGVALGYFHLLGVTGIENGLLAGLAASGIYTLAKRVGGN